MALISGEQMTWHKITLDFESPRDFSENPSTFRDYRLDVTFTNADTGEVITVPGYFAADGDAANSNATSGNVWRANFNPPSEGNWTYEASFRTGNDIAAKTYAEAPNAGRPVGFIDGDSGTFAVTATDKTGDDFRAKGIIVQDEGTHYLQHQGDQDYFIRGGPGIPENFLANKDFDNTANGRHDYATHVRDFNAGDPTWDGGKGKAIIGAANYIAEQGNNSIYLLTNTSGGDARDVSPWTFAAQDTAKNDNGLSNNELDKFSTYDVSKLSQWEIVFDHLDNVGIYKNVLLQETENDQQLDGGTNVSDSSLSVERLVYIREMVARFGHNNGLQWNIGEENTNTGQQRADQAEYLKSVDAYDHLVVVHTYVGDTQEVYNPLLNDVDFDGPSFQATAQSIRDRVIEFREKSAESGDPWVLAWDEDSSDNGIVDPYSNNPDSANEKTLREAFWGTLTAGGSGGNWYFKGSSGHSLDQNYDTFEAHESVWTWTAAATDFFNTHIPFWDMKQADNLTADRDDFVMAKDGEYYAIYVPYGEARDVRLNLNGQGGEQFDVFWYNPRTGGDLIPDGTVNGGGTVQIGGAPSDGGKDWVLLVRNVDAPDFPAPPGGQAPQPSVTPRAPVAPAELEAPVEPAPRETPAEPTPRATPVEPTPRATPAEPASGAFQGENGTIVIQAESAEAVGSWRQSNVDGKTVLLWDAPSSNYNRVDPNEALSYKFVPDEGGTYHIGLNSGRVKSTMGQSDLFENGRPRSDTGNDVYVSVVEVDTGKVVQAPTKLFTALGGTDRELRFGSTFDANHQRPPATVALDADTEYELVITGRSDGYALDLITLNKGSVLKNANAAESPVVGITGSTPQIPPVAPTPPTLDNAAPVAADDTAETGLNSTILVDVLANDRDADRDDLTLTDVSYNGNTSIVEIVDGRISVNPLSGATNARTERVTYTVTDENGATDTATLRVDVGAAAAPTPRPAPTPSAPPSPAPTPPAPVQPANQAPEARNDTAATTQNRTISVDVLRNDSDADGGRLTLTDISYAGDTSDVSIENGRIKVNPLQAATGNRTETITYTVEDADGATDTAVLSVNIGGGAAPAPSATPPVAPAAPAPTTDLGLLLSLVDADADAVIDMFENGDTILVEDLDTSLSLSVTSSLDNVGSMVLRLDGGRAQIENYAPYASFGNEGSDLKGRLMEAGDHTLSISVYAEPDGKGRLLGQETISFSVAEAGTDAEPDGLLNFFIADADSNETIGTLSDGDRIDADTLGESATFYALADSDAIDHVTLTFEGAKSTERVEPYALFGDWEGNFFKGLDLDPGEYTLQAEAFDAGNNVLETVGLQFEIV